jgi:hypothetical protein
MPDITGANAIFTIAVLSVFPAPIQLQGFSAEDVFDTDPIESAEVVMGVDGVLSTGFVFVPVKQTITLQADSASNAIFDAWWAANQVLKKSLAATGIIILTAVNTKWALINGALTSYQPIPNTHKRLQPRRFGITWQAVSPAIT